MNDAKADRVVIRFSLAKSKDEWVRDQIHILANDLENGTLSTEMAAELAQGLRGIAAGVSAEEIFGLGKRRGGQVKIRLHKWMALDYWLRTELGHRKVSACIATDWKEKSVDTVTGIARRYRKFAESKIDEWREQYALNLYIDAVSDVREQLLTGKKKSIKITADEAIEVIMDWEEAIMGPPEIMMPEIKR